MPQAYQHLVVERAAATGSHDPGYSLYFAEFDDQGCQYDSAKYGAAGQQIAAHRDYRVKGSCVRAAGHEQHVASVGTRQPSEPEDLPQGPEWQGAIQSRLW